MSGQRVLVAGIGNIFLGDDAFGSEVARRLGRRQLPDGVAVVDFGIRALDLTYALLDGYDAVILVDAAPRGGRPGTLYVIEPDRNTTPGESDAAPELETHNMDPVKVLRLAESLGGRVERLVVVGCEPTAVDDPEEMRAEMSAPVSSAVDEAIPLIESLVGRILRGESIGAN
jgi:hydrogenase maturation protease